MSFIFIFFYLSLHRSSLYLVLINSLLLDFFSFLFLILLLSDLSLLSFSPSFPTHILTHFVYLSDFLPNITNSKLFFLLPLPFPRAYIVLSSYDKGTALFTHSLAILVHVLLVKLVFFIVIFVISARITEKEKKKLELDPVILVYSLVLGVQ